ncbi:unnamed protein product [Fusarium graminearum]|uniref:Uncharacterized protein n=1 Tax=Gibberella zeae TaxID=5518 RepID=A0A679P758_GIBZA|nr:unnamed protein product [Fusarium graminearum]CAF3504690.1 unnamed protein product [Fusarium graminearum]CAG1997286.1 unnamed protein product [Fusarium graminearum]CZS81844.1 unnamed protein product [Fusarium graminearum]
MCHTDYRDVMCPACGDEKGLPVVVSKLNCTVKDTDDCVQTKSTEFDLITCADCVQAQAEEEEQGYMYSSGK